MRNGHLCFSLLLPKDLYPLLICMYIVRHLDINALVILGQHNYYELTVC